MLRSLREQHDRGDASDGREHRPLECPERQHPDARAAIVFVDRLEHPLVDGEAAAERERTEAGHHDPAHHWQRKRSVAVDRGHRTVGENVRRVREQLGTGDDRDPPRVDVLKGPADRVRAGRIRDQDHRHRRQQSGEDRRQPRPVPEQSAHASRLPGAPRALPGAG